MAQAKENKLKKSLFQRSTSIQSVHSTWTEKKMEKKKPQN